MAKPSFQSSQGFYGATMEQLLCCPGWSGQRSLQTWMGRDATCVPHVDQWEHLKRDEDWEAWIPNRPWGLVTWSMGTWTGLWLLDKLMNSQAHELPKYWIALAPFVSLVDLCTEDKIATSETDAASAHEASKPNEKPNAESEQNVASKPNAEPESNAAPKLNAEPESNAVPKLNAESELNEKVTFPVKRNALELLVQAYERRPEATMAMFARQQGARDPWAGSAWTPSELETMGTSLTALLGPPPHPMPKQAPPVPTTVVVGDRDRLVSESMSRHFSQHVQLETFHVIPDRGHGLFYEELPFWPRETQPQR
jgi:pimeloyl-ACP methyl ester carboxylesterase